MLSMVHALLQAVADCFGLKIYVISSYEEGEVIEIAPRGPLLSKRVLYLSFWAEARAARATKGLLSHVGAPVILHAACWWTAGNNWLYIDY